jgi:DHA1 family tetracycline resistance protein-like MFS transporter
VLREANPFTLFAELARRPALGHLVGVSFLDAVSGVVYPAVWAYFAVAQFGWSTTTVGLSLASYGVFFALIQAGLIRVILRYLGDRGTVIYGLIFNAFAFVFLAFVTNGTLALLFTPITALGAVVTPAIQGIMSRQTPDDAQGELQGVVASAGAVATIISPLLMTGVFSRFTGPDAPVFLPGAPFLVSMLLMGLCLIVFLAPTRRKAA